MTLQNPMSIFKDFDKYFIGFDKVLEQAELAHKYNPITKFPTFNIKKKKGSDNEYVIELFVAGYGETDIEVKLDGDTLIVSGESSSDTDGWEAEYQGAMLSGFERSFNLADNFKVDNVELANGILKIFLDYQVEACKNIKKFEIKT